METTHPHRWIALGAGLILLLIFVFGLITYKVSGSLKTWQTVQAAGKWTRPHAPLTQAANAEQATMTYFKMVWPALVFGVLIGAAVRAFVSPRWITAALGQSTLRQQLVAGVAGSPLMLCSCCVTPIFTGVYERGAKMGPSLTLMLASPGLNLAALALTFALFPLELSLTRLIAVLVVVFGLTALIGKWFAQLDASHLASDKIKKEEDFSLAQLPWRFVRELGLMVWITVPWIALGVFLSSLILPSALHYSQTTALLFIAFIAFIGVLVALPTFFEIPLAFVLLQVGAPVGAAVALLIAGPIVNLPSLFVLGRETSPKVSLALASGIWLIAFASGALVTCFA